MKRVEDYIAAYTRRCSNELDEGVSAMTGDRYAPWLTPEHARSVAVIAREEAIKEACKWVSVNNRLPENGQLVVCTDKQGNFRKSIFHAKDTYPFRAGFSKVDYGDHTSIYHIPFVTHWQPIRVPSEEERMAVLSNWTDNQKLINGDVVCEIKEDGV